MKTRLIQILVVSLTVLLALSLPITVKASEVDDQKLVLIKELIQVTGAATNSQQYSRAFSQQLTSVLKISNPELSQKAIDIVEEEVNNTVSAAFSSESLQSEIYPIYARYFTIEELEGLIAFNRSPAGQKANRVMPQLIAESTQAAQIWARALSPKISHRVLQRFSDEGIDVQLKPTN